MGYPRGNNWATRSVNETFAKGDHRRTLPLNFGVSKMSKDTTDADNALLANWATLNDSIMDLGEEQVKRLLDAEVTGQRRTQFMLRLHGRYNVLRAQRERTEMLAE